MNFCSQCGSRVEQRIPEGENRPRFVCESCETIHYQNPQMVVGIIPIKGDQVLLCRRAIEPRLGYWTLPAGFMENGESTLEGALRETWEEALATVKEETLYRLVDLPHINQVFIFYRAELTNDNFAAGQESLEVRLFSEHDLPWDDIAFPAVKEVLQELFADKRVGEYPVRISAAENNWGQVGSQ